MLPLPNCPYTGQISGYRADYILDKYRGMEQPIYGADIRVRSRPHTRQTAGYGADHILGKHLDIRQVDYL